MAKRNGTWPIFVETDGGTFSLKLSGSGHGISALIAEIIVGELAEFLGLRIPERALITLDPSAVCENEDPELTALLSSSYGCNVGLAMIEKARDFASTDVRFVSREEAALIYWLDWFVMNPDRTATNPNLLIKEGKIWLIDHGSALIFHHDWSAVTEDSPKCPWKHSREHIFREHESESHRWHEFFQLNLSKTMLDSAIGQVPAGYFKAGLADDTAIFRRKSAYSAFLWKRLKTNYSLIRSN